MTRLRLRITIWLLNHGWLKVNPWEDPRRSESDRVMWLNAQPKSLRKVG
jgi:hypothetical protein